ncbi:MAG: 1-deoxy-D-xylulose-5-phosphate reductoisomerase [Halothiobacillaceae bacterium]
MNAATAGRGQRLAIFGSTGSIGKSTLSVVGRHPDRFQITALVAGRNVDCLTGQILHHRPEVVGVADARAADQLAARLAGAAVRPEIVHGPDAIAELARLESVDTCVAAIVGAAGLPSALAAAEAGKRVLLANKESLVMAGALFMDTARASGARLLPVDSEHNAIYQCLEGADRDGVHELVLTASGGPFRQLPAEAFASVTPEQACAHPKWSMGRKISVDSATLMNKGLEVIEAHWLFAMPPEQIRVVVHPQSVIHSMVRFVDGSVLAQLGEPDMRTPIAHALAWPERIDAGVAPLDLFSAGPLTFEPPDLERFPCLSLAYEALAQGGYAPAVLNAANEEAVAAFLEGRLGFDQIGAVVAAALEQVPSGSPQALGALMEVDRSTRRLVQSQFGARAHD